MDLKEKRAALFEDEIYEKPAKIKLKEKTNLIIGSSVIEISNIPAVTVHFDLFYKIVQTAIDKKLNIYVYSCRREGRYAPKNRYYYGIYAVETGTPKTRHTKELPNVVAAIQQFSPMVNHHKNSKSYSQLNTFLDELNMYSDLNAKG